MKKFLLGLLLSIIGLAGNAHAISNLGQEPPADLIVNSGGLQWVWASPCASTATDPNCGDIQFHHNFHIPSVVEWNMGFSNLDALIADFILPTGEARCASAYFNTANDECDPEDILGFELDGVSFPGGGVEGAPFENPFWAGSQFNEQFLVRASVPEPTSMILLGAGLLGLAAWLRKGLRAKPN